jgi:hypothetical protein
MVMPDVESSLLAVITDQEAMIQMSELAFNANGESFDIPATVTGWRVRRMKPRGAPELVYGKDGRPLTVAIDADIDELRDAVGAAAKYRLDPINDDGKCVENVPAAYVHVVKPQRNAEQGMVLAPSGTSDDTLREAMRMNTELAKSVIDKFPDMMQAAAELLRAADGAGLPRRQPREIEAEDDGDELDAAPAPSPAFEMINTLIAQVIPVVIAGFAGKKVNLGAALDWRKAADAGKKEREQKPALAEPTDADATAATAPAEGLPPIDPKIMIHMVAIQNALKPDEVALVKQIAAELSPAELRAWFDELSKLDVAQAVQKIRVLLAGNTEAVS